MRYLSVVIFGIVLFVGKSLAAVETDRDPFILYEQAEKSAVIAEKRELFNQALTAYRALEHSQSSGKLLFNIGNCYAQLEDYPSAILYYERALKLTPRDSKVHANLQQVRQLAKVDRSFESFLQTTLLGSFFSLSEKLVFFMLTLICGMILASVYIWRRWVACQISASALFIIAGLTTINVLVSHYFLPSEGIIMASTVLRCDAGEHYAKSVEEPLIAGSKVQIVAKQGNWLEIALDNRIRGYVPLSTICVLSE